MAYNMYMLEIFVLTPTYNRPESLVRTAQSLITQSATHMVAVDQNPDRPTELYLKKNADEVMNDPQFTYLYSKRRGEAAARNFGIEYFRNRLGPDSLFACIDDDITVSADWNAQIIALAQKYPDIGIFSGAVQQAFTPKEGEVIPVFLPDDPEVIVDLTSFSVGGMTAHMIIRPWVLDQIGGFDPFLGCGSKYGAADDIDVLYRALKNNIPVMAVQSPAVFHHGVRKNEEITELYNRYAYGLGVILGKYQQCGDAGTASIMLKEGSKHVLRAAKAVRETGKPTGIRAAACLVKGFADGYRTPADKDTRKFIG